MVVDYNNNARPSKRHKVPNHVLFSSNTKERVEGCEVVRLEEWSAEMLYMLKALLNKN